MTTTPKNSHYLGDGLTLTLEIGRLSLSGSRPGERPIHLSPETFKRLLRIGLRHLRLPPQSDEGASIELPPAPEARTVPLREISRTRDEEMAEWEATLRRKRAQAIARPQGAPDSPRAAKPIRPISELA